MTSGDSDDYAKILITAPGRPLVDIEMSAIDAYTPYTIKVQGSKGTYKATSAAYEMVYIVDGENPERPVIEASLKGEGGKPIYCSEKLIKHEETGNFNGDAFNVGTSTLYRQLFEAITEGKPMDVTPEMAARIISVAEAVHTQNPLPLKY
jgi:predicted dehydrogenase